MALTTNIKFYSYTGDMRKINKDIGQHLHECNAYLNNECNILAPEISIPYTDTFVQGCNYAYIDAWGRYYYITDFRTDSAGKLYVKMSIDVLKTYATDLLGCPVTVIRSQSVGMNHIVDDKYPLFPDLCNINVIELVPDKPLRKASGNNILLGVL